MTRLRVVTAHTATSRLLRDAGMEVVHVAVQTTPEQLAATAIQEDADCVLVPPGDAEQVRDLLAESGAADIAVLGEPPTAGADVVALIRANVASVTG